MPDQDPQTAPTRIDGRAKLTGTALYTGDVNSFDRYLHPDEPAKPMLHAAVATATIPHGEILNINTEQAEAVPGVEQILTHTNAPRLKKINSLLMSEQSKYLPLQDNLVRYHGQPIALVIATTPEAAREAAATITATYKEQSALLDFEANKDKATKVKKVGAGAKANPSRGDAQESFNKAEIKLDLSYHLQPAHHNAMEPGATVAHWHAEDGLTNRLTVVASTQFVYGDAVALAEAFDLGPKDKLPRIVTQVLTGHEFDSKVRVIAPLIGGGFGSKGGANNTLLAAMAAHATRHPVKLVLTRQDTFSQMPYRGGLDLRIRLGASPHGRLCSLQQDAILQSSNTASFLEPTAEVATHLYDVPNVAITHRALCLHTNSPGWMRAPGVTPGQFALETAMDELAEQASLDPIQLRLLNYAEKDPESGKQWSSKALRACYEEGAHAFNWYRRKPISDERENGDLIGYGMATAAYPTNHFPATARLALGVNGILTAQSATQEIGQGAITALTQVVADALALPITQINFELGDTDQPFGAFSAGSSTTLSVGSALEAAAAELEEKLARLARVDKQSPLYKCALKQIIFREGQLQHRIEESRREPATNILARAGLQSIEAKGIAGRTFGRSDYARMAFGAQFARVAVNPHTGAVRVTHMTGAFAGGRILNARTARSQLLGGMVWGIGHALHEQSLRDTTTGAWVNANLAEAHVPSNADAPQIEVLLIPEDDRKGSQLGAKGLGELGITGASAAIANAIYNATGRRLRNLPITAEAVLGL